MGDTVRSKERRDIEKIVSIAMEQDEPSKLLRMIAEEIEVVTSGDYVPEIVTEIVVNSIGKRDE